MASLCVWYEKCTDIVWSRNFCFEFKLSHNTMEAIKNICCSKGDGTVDHRWFKKFYLGYKNLNDQARSSWPKIMDFKALVQTIETHLVNSTWRVSGKLGISHYSVNRYLHDLCKSICNCQIMPHSILKRYLKTFDSHWPNE